LTMEDMLKNVSRHIDLRSHSTGGLTNDHGVREFAVIGGYSHSEGMPSGRISRPHNFQLRRLMLDPAATIAQHSRQEPEVLFIHHGSLKIITEEGSFTLGAGDLFTCPIDLARGFINDGNEIADIIVLRGGDHPSAAKFF
jgi:quercetin dioxygenase-like cupin family protein